MSELTFVTPVVGEKETAAVPKVDSALTEIKTVVNGKIGAVNLETNAVETEKIKEEAVTGKKLGTETLRMTTSGPEARTERTFGTEYEPSATRAVHVTVEIRYQGSTGERGSTEIFVGPTGALVLYAQSVLPSLTGQTSIALCSFIVPAGKKWKVTAVVNTEKLFSTYTVL